MSNIQAQPFPKGNCVQMSFWQQSGGIWKPIVPTSLGNCTAILRFLNGSEHFIVQPPDHNLEFDRLQAGFDDGKPRPGLDASEKAALEAKFPGAVQDVPGQLLPTFALPMVPFGTNCIDITPPDVSGSQQPPG